MSLRNIMKFLLAAILIIPAFTVAQDDAAEPQEGTVIESQTGEARTTMDLLRQKIAGISAGGIQIIAAGSIVTSGEWIEVTDTAEIRIGLTKSLLADTVRYSPSKNRLEATGNVVLLENKLRIGGDSLNFDLSSNTGEIVNPYVETEDGYTISGTRLEKQGPETYKLHGARLTACNQPTPQWQMAASSITLHAGDKATMRNMRLNLFGGVPVFYTPWVQVPVDQQRGSGFMIPQWGNSDFHGTWIENRYFWAINDSHDATVGLDYYSERGYRYSGEYRNNLGNGNITDMYLYFIEDENFYGPRDDPDDIRTRNRYEGKIVHRSSLPGGFKININMDFLSDNTYRRDFINRDIFYNPLLRKRMSIGNSFAGYSFLLAYNEVSRFRNRNRLSQIRYLPVIDLRSREQQIGDTPIFVSGSANFVRPSIQDIFKRAEFDREDLIEEETYNRTDFQGEVKIPIKNYAPWFTVTPRLAGRTTNYSRSLNPDKRTEFLDESVNRRYWDAGFDITGPVFSKVYGNAAVSRHMFKHIIEPKLSYTYRSEFDEETQKRIIIVDQEDTFFRVNEFRWTLSNILLYKRNYLDQERTSSITELLRFSVSQFISADDQLLTSYDKRYVFNPTDVTPASRYSPLLFNISARIFNNVRAFSNIEYDTIENELANFTVGGNFNFGTFNYNIGYYRNIGVVRFDRAGVTRTSSDRFVTSGSLGLFSNLLRLRGAWDFDFQRDVARNYLAGVDIVGQCLGASFSVRKINLLGQEDLQTRFSITIGGIGGILGGERP